MPDQLFKDLAMPLDANGKPVSTLFGYDPVLDKFYPLAVIDMGNGTFKLMVDAVFSGSITVGDVVLKDPITAEKVRVFDGRQMNYSDDSPMMKKNIKSEYVWWDTGFGIGQIKTIKEYPSDAISGAPAKLTSYTYNAEGKYATITVTDTTV